MSSTPSCARSSEQPSGATPRLADLKIGDRLLAFAKALPQRNPFVGAEAKKRLVRRQIVGWRPEKAPVLRSESNFSQRPMTPRNNGIGKMASL
jgi:hypothetical protein